MNQKISKLSQSGLCAKIFAWCAKRQNF